MTMKNYSVNHSISCITYRSGGWMFTDARLTWPEPLRWRGGEFKLRM
ncbi:hypothetical protein SAMN05216239_0370 [Bacillus amyloliquefaciens]|nr:hypothetical protein SAMN05216239_0370 [Bacillus amyloliquefaciens]